MIKKFEKFNDPEVKIDYYSNGQKRYEEWYLNDKRHREDGPAIQRWYESGQKYEEWYLNNKEHREDDPSCQNWYENGQKRYEYWYLNNKIHREDGPSYQQWLYNGQKNYEEWSLNGNYYKREEWVEELKKIGSPHYEEQKILLDIEKYNI